MGVGDNICAMVIGSPINVSVTKCEVNGFPSKKVNSTRFKAVRSSSITILINRWG